MEGMELTSDISYKQLTNNINKKSAQHLTFLKKKSEHYAAGITFFLILPQNSMKHIMCLLGNSTTILLSSEVWRRSSHFPVHQFWGLQLYNILDYGL